MNTDDARCGGATYRRCLRCGRAQPVPGVHHCRPPYLVWHPLAYEDVVSHVGEDEGCWPDAYTVQFGDWS